ncbi:MAG TPA: hypothetical protein VKH45_11835 [Candidatus Acidoferrum sp.]|nr:hypothetical protein [Candidatus Acidoferrum sp.]
MKRKESCGEIHSNALQYQIMGEEMIKSIGILSTSLLFLLLGFSATAVAHQEPQKNPQDSDKLGKSPEQQEEKAAPPKQERQEPSAKPAQPEHPAQSKPAEVPKQEQHAKPQQTQQHSQTQPQKEPAQKQEAAKSEKQQTRPRAQQPKQEPAQKEQAAKTEKQPTQHTQQQIKAQQVQPQKQEANSAGSPSTPNSKRIQGSNTNKPHLQRALSAPNKRQLRNTRSPRFV